MRLKIPKICVKLVTYLSLTFLKLNINRAHSSYKYFKSSYRFLNIPKMDTYSKNDSKMEGRRFKTFYIKMQLL